MEATTALDNVLTAPYSTTEVRILVVNSFGLIIVNKLYNPFFFLRRNQTISSSWLLPKAWKTSRRQFAIVFNWIVDFNSLSRPFCLIKLFSLPFLVKFKFLFLQLQGLFHSVCVVIWAVSSGTGSSALLSLTQFDEGKLSLVAVSL